MSTEILALILGIAATIIMGLCVVAGARKSDLQEANEERQPQLDPDCAGTECGLCKPGSPGTCPAIKCSRADGERQA